MRIGFIALLFAFSGSIFSARADVIFIGSVGLGDSPQSSGFCYQGAVGEGSFNVSCSGDQGGIYHSRAYGSGDAFSGSLTLDMFAPGYGDDPMANKGANGSAELQLDQVYVLTGGTGTAVINFDVSPGFGVPWGDDGVGAPHGSCTLSFDGMAEQSCGNSFPYSVFSETVQYNVPFAIDFQLTINAVVGGEQEGNGATGELDYSFNAPGLQVVPTPEPSSMLLMIPGLAGIIACARRRLKIQSR